MYLGLGLGLLYRPMAVDASAPATPFSPMDIATPALWLDASDTSTITQAGGAVSQWSDKSGHGHHAEQVTGASQPITGTRTINGLNVIDFDGANDYLKLPSALYSIPAGANTIFVVLAADSDSTIYRFIGGNASGAGRYFIQYRDATSIEIANRNSSPTGIVAAIPPRDLNAHTIGFSRSGAALSPFHDGSAVAIGSYAASDVTLISFEIGRATLNNLNGVLCEIILYDSALPPSDCNLVGNYLAAKWGVTWTGL